MLPEVQPMPPQHNHNRSKLAVDLRWVIIVILLIAIGVMLFLWKPWDNTTSDRTVEVTGEATVTAEPDEFIFYPSYQFANANKQAALEELTKKSNEVTEGLKKVGVAENDIKTNSGGYDYALLPESKDTTYTLQLTVTVENLELAQKVQDYLTTTAPTGGVSPSPTFSDAKRKELESKARSQATEDARAKAEQSGEKLGFKVGKVKSVSDGSGFNLLPFRGEGAAVATDSAANSGSFELHPGENELPYSVTVVYYIR